MTTEAEFQAQVIELAEMLGWRAMHVRRSVSGVKNQQWTTATSVKGWPDLTLWHPKGGLVFLELKSEKGRVTPEQRQVLDELSESALASVMRPSELEDLPRYLSAARVFYSWMREAQ